MRFFNNRPLVITLAIALVLVILILVSPSGLQNGPVGAVGGAVSGTQSFISRAFSAVGNFFGGIFNPGDKDRRIIELEEQLMAYQRREQYYRDLERKLEVLQEQTDYQLSNPDYDYVSANVIAKDNGYYFDTFMIDRGYKHGVQKDDAVVTPDGLVGRITDVGGSTSTVMAIIDSQSSVSCIIERTRDNCMVNGGLQLSDESGLCEIKFLSPEAVLLPGDKVVTNSLGTTMFPKGLVVGEIKQVGNPRANTEADRRTLVQPAVDFLHVEEVMVVIQKAEESPGMLEDDTDTDTDNTPEPTDTTTPTDSLLPTDTTSPSQSPEDGDGEDDNNEDDTGDGQARNGKSP